jgi:4-amino-4-deoxy-L-arabinose transferase-like glycosyltransferase
MSYATAAASQARERTRPSSLAFAASVGAVLIGYLTIELWDLTRYNWLRAYDAWASSLYVDSIRVHHALPSPSTSDVWHNPPLFYALAALIQPHVGWTGIEPHQAVQVVSVLSALGVVVLTFLIARELFPSSRWIQIGALVAAATTPVLARSSVMYHPEPLATVLATGGVFVAVRAAQRGWTSRLGGGAALLLGLADLTRTWALAEGVAVAAIVGLVCLRTRDRDAVRFLATFAAVFVVVSAPWYVRQEIRYGNPVAFSKPDPYQWLPSGRPASFFTTLDVNDVFSNPYQPTYANVILPVVYTDWWGDYSRYFHVPQAETDTPAALPSKYRAPLVLQSVVGILPTLMALVGAIGLAVVAVRRRSASVCIAVAAGALVLVSFVGFLVHYPKRDGDNIKALYILDVVPLFALAAAWSLEWVHRHASRLVLGTVLAWLAATLAYDVSFLIL